MMKSNVNVVIAHYRPDIISGAERSISDFVDKCDRRFQITMLTPGGGSLADYYQRRGFVVWANRIETRRRLYPGLHTLQSLRFARQLKKKKIDAVLCNTYYAALRIKTACRMAGIPYGIYIREYVQNKAIFQVFLDQADKIFAVSRDVKDYLETMTNPEKIVVAYNYINADRILEKVNSYTARDVRILPFSTKHPVVGMVGRVTKYKQQDLFLQAIPYVLSAVPEARFVIVGNAVESEKDYDEYLQKLVVALGIQDKVVLMGQRSDALEIISELAVSCLPSTREPLGRVILESQIIGCPVIATDTGGCPEMIQDGVTGLLFPLAETGSEQLLAQRIVQVLKSYELAKKLVENAKRSVQDKFTGPGNIRKIEQYLEDLAMKNGNPNAS